MAFDKTHFDCASFLKEVFGVCYVVPWCSVLVSPVIPSALKNLRSTPFPQIFALDQGRAMKTMHC